MSNELEIRQNNSLISEKDYEHVMKIANVFADSDLVPEHFKRKPQNVFIVLQMAQRLNLDAMLAIQNIHIIKGRPALSSQMLIGLINASGLIDGVISFTSNGKAVPDLSVTASAKLKGSPMERANGTQQIIEATFSYSQAQAMGTTQNAPWKTAPELMCRYRAASHLARVYFPQLTLGLGNKEELEELEPLNVTPPRTAPATITLASSESSQSEGQEQGQNERNDTTHQVTSRPRGRPRNAKIEIISQQGVHTCESELVPHLNHQEILDSSVQEVGF